MKKIIESHLKHDDFLEKKDIIEISEQYPLCLYHGEAFRILLFSHPQEKIPDISNDVSFSNSLKGIKNYLMNQDFDYYPECIVFKARIKGISINALTKNYSKELGILIDTSKEEEVCPETIDEVEVIFKGPTTKFYSSL